jgi:hypothetical protein
MGCIEIFKDNLPKRPYHSDDFAQGLRINSKENAVKARHIQANGPTHKFWLIYDLDREDAGLRWDDVGAPPPNIVTRNPVNGHAHLMYGLVTPIRTALDGKKGPLRYAAAIDNALCDLLGADKGYSGLICKNPLHGDWLVEQWETSLYELDGLADFLELTPYQQINKKQTEYGVRRNCTLFEELRAWAYNAIRQGWPDYNQWLRACVDKALAYNIQFPRPLDGMEVKHIARSVAKWTYKNFSSQKFSAIQSARGLKGGLAKGKCKREAGLIMLQSGANVPEVMEVLSVSRRTVFNWLARI